MLSNVVKRTTANCTPGTTRICVGRSGVLAAMRIPIAARTPLLHETCRRLHLRYVLADTHRVRKICTLTLLGVCLLNTAAAHEVRPAYLALEETASDTYQVTWKVPLWQGQPLALTPAFPDGCERVGAETYRRDGSALLGHWTLQCTGPLPGGRIAIDGLQYTFIDALLRIGFADGRSHTARLTPSAPGHEIAAAASATAILSTYLTLGVEHILGGFDHLLFVVALLLLVNGVWPLVKTITAFTIAHSITLALASLGLMYLPGPPVEAVIALSIVFVARELLRPAQRRGLAAKHPWAIAFVFGLLHGFGFAGALTEIGLPQGDVPLALFSFNVGVELGQLAVVAAALAVIFALQRLRLPRFAVGYPVVVYGIGGIAAFWVIDRLTAFMV